MLLRSIFTLACFLSFSSASSNPGYNTPILLNLSPYHSLDPYQQTIDGAIELHLTLVFTQMSNEMIVAVKDPLEEQLRNSIILNKMIKDVSLNFTEFGLLGNHLVAFYAPINQNVKTYRKFIEKIRQLVRQMAEQMGNLEYSQKNQVEYGRLGKDIVYTMDIRDPLPHVSLKYKGTAEDVQKLNELWQNDILQKPKPIFIRLNQIELHLTKAIDL